MDPGNGRVGDGWQGPRSLAYDPTHQVVFESSIGPNIGPNPQRVEVSMNSGIGVLSLSEKKFVHHLGLGEGVCGGIGHR